jgi:F420-dependent oxidoreductase-like protein
VTSEGGIKLGLQINRFNYPGGEASLGRTLADIARRAEEAGFSSVWMMDHFFQLPGLGPAEDPMLEGYAALAYVAAVTERVKLGAMVTGVTYRHPGVLVKTVTTLDVLSGGRAYLGIGAAWFEREHLGLGVPFPPVKERFERLEETLQIAHQMWSGEVKPYQGKHYQLAEALNQPMPASKPYPPILIGGGGERKTLRFVAKYGDACNLFSADLEALARKLEVLRGHCEAEGRPYAEIEKTSLGRQPAITRAGGEGSAPADQLVDLLGHLAELGVDHHLINLPNVADPTAFDAIAEEVIPAARRLRVAGRP